MSKASYEELATCDLSPTRKLVISKCSLGGYTLGQKLVVDEGYGKETGAFLKGSITFPDINSLKRLSESIITVTKNENF